jgi:hypothetical protein
MIGILVMQHSRRVAAYQLLFNADHQRAEVQAFVLGETG